MDHALSRRQALLLFAVVILSWGLNWAVTKELVRAMPPFWAAAIRSGVATVAVGALLGVRGEMIVPRRGDYPMVAAVGILHMVCFSGLVAYGVQLVPVGRSVVLGYTFPLWVAPAAWLLLGERLPPLRLAGLLLGMAGLGVMFNPAAFDWGSRGALVGNGMILLAAVCWAVVVLYMRVHRWIASPLQLLFWQTVVATVLLTGLAWAVNGVPHVVWTPLLVGNFLYGGVIGGSLAYWAMSLVNRSLPAVTTSLGVLATPVVGVITSVVVFGEVVTASLVLAMVMILGGIALGTVPARRA